METTDQHLAALPDGGDSAGGSAGIALSRLDAPQAAVSAAAAYLAELHSEDSRRAVRSRLSIAARWLGAEDAFSCDWGKLRYAHVVAFMHELADRQGLAASSVNAYLSALKGVADTAWRLRQMDMASAAEIRAVKQLRIHREPAGRALDREESARLTQAAGSSAGIRGLRDQAIIALLLGCGLRRAEAASLRAEHLDRTSSALRVIGKGNKERRVFLTPEVAEHIDAWLAVRGTEPGWLFSRITKGGRLMPENPLDPASVGRIVSRAQAEAGIADITPHDLRRTFATRLLMKNVDITAVKTLMGHASVTTTAKYDRRGEAALRQAAMEAEL